MTMPFGWRSPTMASEAPASIGGPGCADSRIGSTPSAVHFTSTVLPAPGHDWRAISRWASSSIRPGEREASVERGADGRAAVTGADDLHEVERERVTGHDIGVRLDPVGDEVEGPVGPDLVGALVREGQFVPVSALVLGELAVIER